MKIIFIDIDGCLNTEKWRNSTEDYFDMPICEEHMIWLKFICDATESRLVLSSSWREHWNEDAQQVDPIGDYFNKIFAKFGLEIYSKTPEFPGNNRNEEIEAWLAANQVENYVIIDDIDYNFKKHFVKTSDEFGLNQEACEKAIKILNGEDYAEFKNEDEEWHQVTEFIKDAVGETTFNIWFKKLKVKEYFPKSNTLFLSCHSFSRRIIEDYERFSDILDKAIRVVFGDSIKYQIEDENIDEYDV